MVAGDNERTVMDLTNAVTTLSNGVNHVTGTTWPIVIGIVGALIALSVFLKVGRKGGVRT